MGLVRVDSRLGAVCPQIACLEARTGAVQRFNCLRVLAAIASHNRLDTFGPAPARFEPSPHRRHVAELDDLNTAFVDRPSLVGCVEVLTLHLCHLLFSSFRWSPERFWPNPLSMISI